MSTTTSFGQLVVNENATIAQMTTSIQGTGVTISNMTITSGANQQISSFTNTNVAGNPLTIPNGILLSTGRGNTAIGPNNSNSASTSNGIIYNDPDLQALEALANRDVVILEFDVVPITDTLQLVFQFGSEEYPEYVCGGFNDAFAFFVSGPGIVGPFSGSAQNFARLPSGTHVSIDNVNNVGTCVPNNSIFYINNTPNTFLQADGMTTRLFVKGTVQPCQTYHVKCALADPGDMIYDSWVFLDGFSALGQNLNFTPVVAGQQLTEGCNSVQYNLTRSGDLSVPVTVNLTYSGTATAGVDYTAMPSSVTFASGQATIPLIFDALGDGVAEATENINITAQWNLCALSQSASYSVPIINRTVSITCPSNITTNVAAGTCTAPVTYTTPTATESCGSCAAPTSLAGFTYLGTYNNHKYFRSNSSVTWATARANALSLGGHLATISSAGENAFMAGLGLHWIGFTDQAVEGTWIWTNGEPVVYTNWFAGEPNNAANDDFARINWSGSNQWDDQPASTTAPYILEFDCPVVTRTAGLASGANFPVGTTLVTHVATDDFGNTANCSFTVTVIDNISPTITCPANIIAFTNSSSCNRSVVVSNPTISDNCAVTQLTWTMTGADPIAPEDGVAVDYELPEYTDNCAAMLTLIAGPNTGDIFLHGYTDVTYVATDAAGWADTCTFQVLVNNAPIAVDDYDDFLEEDEVIIVDLLGDDFDIDNDSIYISGVTAGAGQVTLNDDGTISYSIDPEVWCGIDTVWYTLCDSYNACDTGFVAIDVECFLDIIIPEGISPNGDGVNDVFEVVGLEDFPEGKLSIFNRWGHMVYQQSSYQNDWDGTSESPVTIGNGMLPKGTYFYVLDLGEYGTRKGYFFLNR